MTTVTVIGQFCSEGGLYPGMDVYSQEGEDILLGYIIRVGSGSFECVLGDDFSRQRLIDAKGVTVVKAVEHSFCRLPIRAEEFFVTEGSD